MRNHLKIFTATSLLALSIVTLSGCSNYKVDDGDAYVALKQFVPAHEKSGTHLVGKVPMKTTKHIPDSWTISLTQGDNYYEVSVAKALYELIEENSTVCVSDERIVDVKPC